MLEIHRLAQATDGAHRFMSAELIDISNVGIDGEVTGPRARENHQQSRQPALDQRQLVPAACGEVLVLSAVVLPERGGETEFCDPARRVRLLLQTS